MQRVRLPLTGRRIDPSRLFHLRTSAGITQKEVAERAEISDYWYRLIEHGTRVPSLPVAESIASALGVSLDDICAILPLEDAA
jgi:transcriptional regulator with XRE-family HTH domain